MTNQPLAGAPAWRMPTELYGGIVRQLSPSSDLYRLLWISRDFSTEVLRQLYCVVDFPLLYHSSRTEGPTRCKTLIRTLRHAPYLCQYVKGVRLLDGGVRDFDNIAEFLRLLPNVKWLHLLRSFEWEYTEVSTMLFGGSDYLPTVAVRTSRAHILANHIDALFGLHPGRYLDELAWYTTALDPELIPSHSLSRLSVLHGRPALLNFIYPHCAQTLTRAKIAWFAEDFELDEKALQVISAGDSALLALSLHCPSQTLREAIKVPFPRLVYLEWHHQNTYASNGPAPYTFDETPADRIKTLAEPLRSVLQFVPSLRKLKISWIGEYGTNETEGGYIAPIKTLFGVNETLQEVEFNVPGEWPHISHLRLKRGAEEPVEIESDGNEWLWYR